ncbi:GNAT family N-acetyltransferase [Streptomyces sp. NPDC058307]|uniref:GNAT family N-acetyltransferase n=1 Tax=Streptomyces sp. NPDC058307 TaxID=3346439 RepID=UPI0036E6B429
MAYDGEVVGHLTGSLTEPSAVRPVKAATLNGLYVRPAHRRGRVGARLVAEFLAWAGAQGAVQAEVAAYAANPEAIRFYERQGFGAHAVTLRHVLGRKAEVEAGANGQTDTVETITQVELSQEDGDGFAARTGFDPRQLTTPYLYFRVRPRRVQAWREVEELTGRDLMRDGEWSVAD